MRLHKNLGHPDTALLIRASRLGSANLTAIRAARGLRCDACAESRPPQPHLTSKLAETYTETYTEFGQGVE
eukprot:182789-Prorocentrum_lima.AAC.1